MSLLTNNSAVNTTSTHLSRVKWVALALPIAVAAGCAGHHKRDVVDYTVSEEEYLALTTSAAPQEIVAAADEQQATDSVLLTEAAAAVNSAVTADAVNAANAASLPPVQEPVLAAAKPAPVAAPATAQMEDKKSPLPALTSPTVAATEAEPELAAAFDINKLGFTPSLYASAGLGISRMNPDTSAAPAFSTDNNIDPAGQVTLGVDLLKNLSVEVHSADFGSTKLSPEGRVNFHVNGVSALLYAGKAAGRYRRNGWNGYARIGYNEIENTPVGNVPFIEQSSGRGSFGLGVEYNTRRGLGFRADAIAFDGDVQYGQLGVLYRVGKKPKRSPLALAPELPATPVTETPASPVLQAAIPEPAAPMIPPVIAPVDDSVSDEVMLSQITPASPITNECTQLNGTIDDVTFRNGSSELTLAALGALDSVARTLRGCADQEIVVSAHTDNSGSAIANDRLSKMRARTVAIYLGRRGVSMNRMRAVAYGESRPIASNDSPDGRMRNRRVELEVR